MNNQQQFNQGMSPLEVDQLIELIRKEQVEDMLDLKMDLRQIPSVDESTRQFFLSSIQKPSDFFPRKSVDSAVVAMMGLKTEKQKTGWKLSKSIGLR